MLQGASSTSTTWNGPPAGTPRSSSGWWASAQPFREPGSSSRSISSTATSVRTGCWRRPSGCSTADIFGSAVRCTPIRTGSFGPGHGTPRRPAGRPISSLGPSTHSNGISAHDRGQLGDAQPGKCPARGRRRKDRRHRPDDGGRHAVGGKGRAQTVADLELRAGMALPAPPPSRIPHRRPGPRGIPSPHLRAPLPASCFPSAQRLNSARRRAVLDRHG